MTAPERILTSVDLPAPFSPRSRAPRRAAIEVDVLQRGDAAIILADAFSSPAAGALRSAGRSWRRSLVGECGDDPVALGGEI
jgi:hypothetical protein